MYTIDADTVRRLEWLRSMEGKGVVVEPITLHGMRRGLGHDELASTLAISPHTLARMGCGSMTMPAELLAQLLHIQSGFGVEETLKRYCTARHRKGNTKVREGFIGRYPDFIEEWCSHG